MFILPHHLQTALDRDMKGKLVQLDFSAAVDRGGGGHRCLLYKLMSISVGGRFLFLVSEFLSGRRQRVCLDSKAIASVDVVSGVPQGSVLGPLLFTLYSSELFHIVGNHIVGYADDTMIYAVIPRPLSHPQVMKSLNQNLAAINSWCLEWHMMLNPNKTKSMVFSRFRTIASGYGDLTLGGGELEELKSLRILGVTLDSMLTFDTHFSGSCVKGSQESERRAPNRKDA